MNDYKYAMQLRAEELAEESGLNFCELSEERKDKLFNQAMQDVYDQMLARAELARDDLD